MPERQISDQYAEELSNSQRWSHFLVKLWVFPLDEIVRCPRTGGTPTGWQNDSYLQQGIVPGDFEGTFEL